MITSSSIELPDDYLGLGNTQNKEGIFRGVIVGDGSVITNKSENPLIHTSYGSVVKDLRVVIDNANITISQASVQDFNENGCKSYGGIIGQILGGDNIMDAVSVGFSNRTTITLSGSQAQLIPVGGYVGVISYGSLIFRGMSRNPEKSTDIQGIPKNSDIVRSGEETNLIDETNTMWLYVNPIVGRVINAAVFTESDTYRPFEDGTRKYLDEHGVEQIKYWDENAEDHGAVTMKNGTKNYSISDLVKPSAVDMSDRLYVDNYYKYDNTNSPYYTDYKSGNNSGDTYVTSMTIPNEQSLYILSLLIQGKMTTTWYKQNHSYYYNQGGNGGYGTDGTTYKTSHLAEYSNVGNVTSNTDLDYQLAQNDKYTRTDNVSTQLIPYFVYAYTKPFDNEDTDAKHNGKMYGVFAISNGGTVCHQAVLGENDSSTWYMPDGFKGLGCIFKIANTNNINDLTLSINNLVGNNHTISLNMSLRHYEYSFENYMPSDQGNGVGFGFFNTFRQQRYDRGDVKPDNLVKDLIFTGSVYYNTTFQEINLHQSKYQKIPKKLEYF